MFFVLVLFQTELVGDRYRHFNQLVPEFNKFLLDNAITSTGLDKQGGADLLGARFFGRWRSGKCDYDELVYFILNDFCFR